MATLGNDLLHAYRLWRRAPVFAVAVVCTVALAVSAATGVFSVVYGLFRPLPYPESGRLVSFQSLFGVPETRMSVAPEDFLRWRQRARSFSRMAALRSAAVSFTVPGGASESVRGGDVTEEYFDLLGCPPLAGRLLRDADYAPGAPPVAVISRGLWRHRLGGDARAVGRTVLLNGQPVRVVGIFSNQITEAISDVWRPLLAGAVADQEGLILGVTGRLAPGVSLEQARREMEAIAADLKRLRPQRPLGIELMPLHDRLLESVQRGRLAALLAAASCLFLAACSNLASLGFAWLSWRRREIAIRAALGAPPGRIVGQLLAEALALAGAGGAFGVMLAATGMPLILDLNPGAVPRTATVSVDGFALLFALTATLLAGTAVGLWPALDAARPTLLPLLGDAVGGLRERKPVRWTGGVLIAVEMAVAFVLLTGAGLSARELFHLAAVDPGFKAEGRLAVRLALPEPRYGYSAQSAFYTALAERLRGRPELAAVGVLSDLPMRPGGMALDFLLPGEKPPVHHVAVLRCVTRGTFAALGIPLLAGRDVSPEDGRRTAAVALVNESLARRLWPGLPAVGRTVAIPQSGSKIVETRIVGVVADFRNRLEEEPEPEIYLPFGQWGVPAATVVARTTAGPKAMDSLLREVVRTLDPGVPVETAVPLRGVVSGSLSSLRLGAVLLALSAALALALAAVGVYGVISYSVARRRREIALRLALGARRGDILWLVCRQTLIPSLAGLAAGFLAALAAGRLLAAQLVGVSAVDPAVFLTVFSILLGVALCATAEPALRVAATNPADAMR